MVVFKDTSPSNNGPQRFCLIGREDGRVTLRTKSLDEDLVLSPGEVFEIEVAVIHNGSVPVTTTVTRSKL